MSAGVHESNFGPGMAAARVSVYTIGVAVMHASDFGFVGCYC